MNKKVKHVTIWNAITSLLLQLITILSGFIIPRLILRTFGSEVNGLISSLNQFLNYVTLLEGGISSVILASLYKPLYEKDSDKISSVVKTTQQFYKKLAMIFIGYTLLLAILYPIIFSLSFSYQYVFSLTLILSINIFVQYNFSASWKLLLNADKKVYIVSLIQIILIILNTVLFAILINLFPNIHFLKLITASVYLLQPICFHRFVKKYYQIDPNVKEDEKLLKSRWDGFGISIAAFIHKNTDIAILTFFTNLKVVSIYSVYNLVTNGLRLIITSFSAGIIPTMGHLYAKNNKEELNQLFSFYEYIIFLGTFFFFTVGALLITPFVLLYTKNVTDINYYEPIFGLLLILSEAIFCIKEPFVNIAYSAGKFKEIKKHAYIEAGLNIVISIILVNMYGLIGVAIGTLIAMTYRTAYHIIYLKSNILKRSLWKFMKKLICFSVITALGVLLCKLI
ncbi:MAG: polysaccharide biosynthesis C-terminal domain-containing protein, partial [Bacilli bacterium]|nr:polysaccharide biosynthesis C-terminal domain-containing protein [Bacilli bacterium]